MKYQYKGDTTYRNLEAGQTVIFVYSNAELTKVANLYSENGKTLYASGQSTVNLTNIDILYTTSANDITGHVCGNQDGRATARSNGHEARRSKRWQYSRIVAAMRVPLSFHSMPHSSLPTLQRIMHGWLRSRSIMRFSRRVCSSLTPVRRFSSITRMPRLSQASSISGVIGLWEER